MALFGKYSALMKEAITSNYNATNESLASKDVTPDDIEEINDLQQDANYTKKIYDRFRVVGEDIFEDMLSNVAEDQSKLDLMIKQVTVVVEIFKALSKSATKMKAILKRLAKEASKPAPKPRSKGKGGAKTKSPSKPRVKSTSTTSKSSRRVVKAKETISETPATIDADEPEQLDIEPTPLDIDEDNNSSNPYDDIQEDIMELKWDGDSEEEENQ